MSEAKQAACTCKSAPSSHEWINGMPGQRPRVMEDPRCPKHGNCTCLPERRTLSDGANFTRPGRIDPRCPQHGDEQIQGKQEDDEPSARVMLATLIDRLTNAVAEVKARIRPWEAGPVAIQWIEHEIAPLLATYLEKTAGRSLFPCPVCDDGEGLSPSTLPCIVECSCGHLVSMADQGSEARRRVLLPISSDDEIPPGFTIELTTRPQREQFCIERLVITNPTAWEVTDLRIGNRSQCENAIPIPGIVFAVDAPDPRWTIDTCATSMDILLEVRNISDSPEVFSATFIGTRGDLSEARMASIVKRMQAAANAANAQAGIASDEQEPTS